MSATYWSLEALDINHRIQPLPFRVRALGFKQFSLRHVIRVLPGKPVDGFLVSRRSEHAVFPFGFRR
jgi:hypothetical protein